MHIIDLVNRVITDPLDNQSRFFIIRVADQNARNLAYSARENARLLAITTAENARIAELNNPVQNKYLKYKNKYFQLKNILNNA